MSFDIWQLSKGDKDGLGLACSEDGLFLGQTALLERAEGGFAPRRQHELERLLACAYGAPVSVEDKMPGLASVAKALNKGDLCLARIAAVHLRLPDLPGPVAKLATEFQDLIIDLERRDSPLLNKARLLKEDWDPTMHPRLGGPPNPGWFAPTDGAGNSGSDADETTGEDKDRVTLAPAPGERFDHLQDLVEWIANAKPEDEAAIRAEIKRLFYDAGDVRGGNQLNEALSDALVPGVDKQERQQILDSIDAYTRADPREMALIEYGLAAGVLAGVPEEASPPPSRGPKPEWDLTPTDRGNAIDQMRGHNTPKNYPVVDNWTDNIATSVKSIDLRTPTYLSPVNLASSLNRSMNQLADFEGYTLSDFTIEAGQIQGRVLEVVVPEGSITKVQRAVFSRARVRAEELGIQLKVIEY